MKNVAKNEIFHKILHYESKILIQIGGHADAKNDAKNDAEQIDFQNAFEINFKLISGMKGKFICQKLLQWY
jgi:hypothetical protein